MELFELFQSPAFYSAVAACCSAICTGFILWIHRSNYLDSVRPIIVVTEWERQRGMRDRILIRNIKNIGKGIALNLLISADLPDTSKTPYALLSNSRFPHLPSNDEMQCNSEITLFWNREIEPNEEQYINIEIEFRAVDMLRRMHAVNYSLLAMLQSKQGDIAEGVLWRDRSTYYYVIAMAKTKRAFNSKIQHAKTKFKMQWFRLCSLAKVKSRILWPG